MIERYVGFYRVDSSYVTHLIGIVRNMLSFAVMVLE
jgi:hypothetical protein